MSTPPAVKRWWVANLRGAAGAAAAFSALLSPGGLSPLEASSARTAAVVETNRVKRMASVALRMHRISLVMSQIRLERAEVSGGRLSVRVGATESRRSLLRWIAAPAKDNATTTLEKRLWDAADQLRANSGLKAQEYSGPILGLIFLRFADVRFATQRAKLEKAGASSRRGSRVDEPAAYHAGGILYLAPEARFDHLLTLPEAAGIGAKVNAAMREIEKHNPQLAGVLPKTYNLFTGTLLKELLKKVSEIPASVDFDAFGRIYEYFLGEFARTEGQKGGEFYTPSSIVKLLTEIIEPFHGRILDPACGSGGMFVQSARFVAEHQQNPAAELALCGVEKTDETGRLCRLNLAIHGLEGDVRHGGNVNSYYDDPHAATGQFDFVLANPPFNVNAVDKERLKDRAGPGRRFPFGLPRTDNANYLWIQIFYSALKDRVAGTSGARAGFVMANSA